MDTIKPPQQKAVAPQERVNQSEAPEMSEEDMNLAEITGKTLLYWKAPEYHHYDKTIDWYWWVGLVAVGLFGVAVWQGSLLFGILVLISWFVIVLYGIRKPDMLNFSICEHGILVEKTLYPWNNLKSFWIFHHPPLIKEISFESRKTFMPYIRIPLGDRKVDEAREILKKYIPEAEQEESVIDHLSHLARF